MTFFTYVFGDAKGLMTIVLPDRNGKPTNEFWFTYPEELEQAEQLVAENQYKDVWYSPILYKEKRRLKDNALTVRVLAADADTCPPDNFRAQPSFVVASSPERYQVYWALTENIDPHYAAKVNRRISQVHASEGCDIAFVNAAKLMRVPGTSNSKHPGAVVVLADLDDTVYDLEELEQQYPASEIPDVKEYDSETVPEGLETFVLDQQNRTNLMNGIPNSEQLRGLLMDQWIESKRSHMRFRLLCDLYRLELSDEAVMSLAWWAPSNKYRDDDPRGVKGLWDEAVKAKNIVAEEHEGYTANTDRDGDYDWNDADTVGQVELPTVATDFLTATERDNLTVTFVDEWVQWAASKTDAPAEYHRSAAVTLLSAVYSEFGHAFPQFGELKLNIWTMVLGRSTKDRKSTARGYMEKAFRALKTDDYDYSLGDDVTPGGVTLALHDRPNKASVFSKDEAQGLFKELLGQSYMVGGVETFTKLYDGWSGGRVRASGDKKILESVPVSFIMYLMGILTESAEVLTVTNYKSGFLTRFVYVIGSRPEGYKSPDLLQGTEDGGGVDMVFEGMMNHLRSSRGFWELTKPETGTFRMYADDDAWDRFIKFMNDADLMAEASAYAEIIGTTTERMKFSILKLATIFAMDARSKKIKLAHMLQAIDFAGPWFDNAVVVASMVSESEWQRDVDALEKHLNSKGGKMSYAQAYRAFKDKRAFEFEEMVIALERRGIVKRINVGSRWDLEIEFRE